MKILSEINKMGYFPFIAIDEFSFYKQMVDKGLVEPSFLQQIRELTIDSEQASFIFAGVYDLIDMLKDPEYGITSSLANTIELQIGPIDEKESAKLIDVSKKINFTKEANEYIREISNNIPFFIQMICRRCGWYAQATGRDLIGIPEIEKIIQKMVGENVDEIPGGVIKLDRQFRDTQYRPTNDEKYINAVISTIALYSKGRAKSRWIDRDQLIVTWGNHRATKELKSGALANISIYPKIQEAIETLCRRGVLKERLIGDTPEYRIGLELFRRWWCQEHPDLESELDKLILNV